MRSYPGWHRHRLLSPAGAVLGHRKARTRRCHRANCFRRSSGNGKDDAGSRVGAPAGRRLSAHRYDRARYSFGRGSAGWCGRLPRRLRGRRGELAPRANRGGRFRQPIADHTRGLAHCRAAYGRGSCRSSGRLLRPSRAPTSGRDTQPGYCRTAPSHLARCCDARVRAVGSRADRDRHGRSDRRAKLSRAASSAIHAAAELMRRGGILGEVVSGEW